MGKFGELRPFSDQGKLCNVIRRNSSINVRNKQCAYRIKHAYLSMKGKILILRMLANLFGSLAARVCVSG